MRRHARPPLPVAPRESRQCNPDGRKNTCHVNSGRSLAPQGGDNFFPLGIPEDSLILGAITGTRSPPVIPYFPPYLVFDSGTRTSPWRVQRVWPSLLPVRRELSFGSRRSLPNGFRNDALRQPVEAGAEGLCAFAEIPLGISWGFGGGKKRAGTGPCDELQR